MTYKKAFLITLIALLLLILAFILIPLMFGYSIGFLNGYQFKLENIYFVFSILGVFATLGAVGVAIWIPNKIANNQNKITLFEKRYDGYEELRKIFIFKEHLKINDKTKDAMYSISLLYEMKVYDHQTLYLLTYSEIANTINLHQEKFCIGLLLFGVDYNDNEINDMFNDFKAIIREAHPKAMKNINESISANLINKFIISSKKYTDYISVMEQQLKL